ncbi:4-hydroxybenzoate octaprenyltransferase [Gammaproteobacteria bacterium]|nr:4-hydroxybenzoate octaprenyltransferase [Gammaproteobacteria bacterium]
MSISAYLKLIRLHQPRGIILLAWPTLMPFALYPNSGTLNILGIFILGIIITRSFGCLVNDYWDQDIDPLVLRTQDRPLATNVVNNHDALKLGIILAGCAFCLWLQLGGYAQILALCALIMMCLYPLMKRVMPLPQMVLGLTFAMGYPIACAELGVIIDSKVIFGYLFWAYWVFIYDTLYARADYPDDLQLGLYSSAVYFSSHVIEVLRYCTLLLIILMQIIGLCFDCKLPYFIGSMLLGAYLLKDLLHLDLMKRKCWTDAFLSHQWIGGIYVLLILLDRISV